MAQGPKDNDPSDIDPLAHLLRSFPEGWTKVDGEWFRTQAVEVLYDDGETFTAYILKDGCS